MCIIKDSLPQAPDAHHYEIEKVSKMVTKVWLVRDEKSDFLEKEVRTIYCFIKGSKNLQIHKPKNSKTCYVKSYCGLDELSQQSGYSLYKPKDGITALFD